MYIGDFICLFASNCNRGDPYGPRGPHRPHKPILYMKEPAILQSIDQQNYGLSFVIFYILAMNQTLAYEIDFNDT